MTTETLPTPEQLFEPTWIDVGEIEPSPFQPRRSMNESALAELAANIANNGIQQAPHVRPVKGRFPVKYQLVFGHRRLEAAKRAGFAQIPAVVRPDLANDDPRTALLAHSENADIEPVSDADD